MHMDIYLFVLTGKNKCGGGGVLHRIVKYVIGLRIDEKVGIAGLCTDIEDLIKLHAVCIMWYISVSR